MGERVFVVVHVAEVDVVAVVVDAGHQLHARRGAERRRMHVLVTDGPCRQRVEVRGAVSGASVTPDALRADVVGQYQDDVGAGFLLLGAPRGSYRQQAESGRSEFPVHGWVSFLWVSISQI